MPAPRRQHHDTCPTVAFTPDTSHFLHDIPATVTAMQPLVDGGYILALEYSQPVRYGKELITHIDAHSADVVEVQDAIVFDWRAELERAA